jgi:hypothetical protein
VVEYLVQDVAQRHGIACAHHLNRTRETMSSWRDSTNQFQELIKRSNQQNRDVPAASKSNPVVKKSNG